MLIWLLEKVAIRAENAHSRKSNYSDVYEHYARLMCLIQTATFNKAHI